MEKARRNEVLPSLLDEDAGWGVRDRIEVRVRAMVRVRLGLGLEEG